MQLTQLVQSCILLKEQSWAGRELHSTCSQPRQAPRAPQGLGWALGGKKLGREESSSDPSLAMGKKWCQTTVPVVSNVGGQSWRKAPAPQASAAGSLGTW